ncbi:hypothetical protein J1N35_012247 [Gossypium stocksii]|uniref:Uncharacterized protein n=1 Tax=Gossypium stocksii TaxID=47602 RepID=A0A9D4AE34_9ROSI|nr:hypothetical protein J1N35_012247 [Gossypium stocksii]
MGQFCIELNVDLMGLLLALVIAIALLLSCVTQPPRPRQPVVVTHRLVFIFDIVVQSLFKYQNSRVSLLGKGYSLIKSIRD